MEKGHYFYLTAIAAVLILVAAGYIVLNLNSQGYKYRVVQGGMEFVSNEGQPVDILLDFKNYASFIVSPQLVKQGPENSYMTTSITMFNTVLTAKKENPVIVARILDETGALSDCQSNLGDVKVNKAITIPECTALISDKTSARVFIELPDTKLTAPRVVLEKGVIRIYPSSYESVSGVTFAVLNALYPDSAQIISNVNSLAGKI